MVTMLDCIRRVPLRLGAILENREKNFAALHAALKTRKPLHEIVLIGSGTSNTSSITAKYAMQEAAGMPVQVVVPSDFLYYNGAPDPDALHVFVSQSGTSAMTRLAIAKARKAGALTLVISEKADNPAAVEADLFLCMECGHEEYGMRTIGYSTSVATLILLGTELGLFYKHISEEKAAAFRSELKSSAEAIPDVIEKALSWMDRERRVLLRADCIIFTGPGALKGIAQEASVKLWETPQVAAFHYDLEEGLHAPNFGYDHRHCVLILNDGGPEKEKALALASYLKNELGNGFVIGSDALDEHDLSFAPIGGHFSCLLYAAAIQVIAYRFAVDQGRDLLHLTPNQAMKKYFDSHRDVTPDELKNASL